MTDNNLANIKVFFDSNIKQQFFNLLNDLEQDISKINCKSLYSPLLSNIRKSRTEIQSTIDTISLWFERKEIKHINFTLPDVIDTSKEVINNIFHSIKLNINLENGNKDIFYGKYFINFVDCFKIFLENIANYALEKDCKIANLSINIEDNETYFICNIKNELINTDENELKMIDEKILKKEIEIKQPARSNANRTEGNTGIIKATNILKRSLVNIENKITFKRVDLNIIIEFKIYKKGIVYENIDS